MAYQKVISAMEKNKAAKRERESKGAKREVGCRVDCFHHSRGRPHRKRRHLGKDLKRWRGHKNVWKEPSEQREQHMQSPWGASMSKGFEDQKGGQQAWAEKGRTAEVRAERKWGLVGLAVRIVLFLRWRATEQNHGVVGFMFETITLATILRTEWRVRVADIKS